MEAFLRKRGVHENTLKSLRDQKIDEDAVRGMSDADLSEYLQKKGDRFALKEFITQGMEKPKPSKVSLMDRLRDRLRSSKTNNVDTSTDDSGSSGRKVPKLSAKKQVHKVHLGWYHFDEKKKMYVHVRAKAGGGKRTLMLNKNLNKCSIISECLELFFPNGTSQHGELKDMSVELTDFQLKPLEDEVTTLGDIIDKAKLQFIHFYLRTRIRKPILEDGSSQKAEIEEPSCNLSSNSDLYYNPEDTIEVGDDASSEPPRSSTHTAESNVPENSQIVSISSPIFLPVWEDSLEEVAFTHTDPIERSFFQPKDIEMVVHRGQVLRELIAIFKENQNIDLLRDNITATMILPNGEREQAYDSGGVMRDMLTEFWEDFYDQCTTGSHLKVPCLRHDMEAADWRSVGKIIALGWILQKVLPIQLAPNFLKCSLYGIACSNLREEFLQFIPQSESMLLSSALENIENVEMDELIEILSSHNCKVKVSKDNLESVIDQIAHMEMVQEPSFIRECLFEVLIMYELNINVDDEFQKIKPSSKKLISCLKCDEPESDSFKYLKRYIREIDTDTKLLHTLLRFLTASDLMLYNSEGIFYNIHVKIVDLQGVARRPVAHTCGRILDLPRVYEGYPVFKSEMNAVLNSNIWVMDFA